MSETTSNHYRDPDRDGDGWAAQSKPDQPIREAGDARFEALVDKSPDGIVVHQEGRIVYANKTFVRWVGAQFADQVEGQAITAFMPSGALEPAMMRMAALRRDGDVTRPAESVVGRMDGTSLDVEVITMLTTWNGEPAYHATFRDLTFVRTAQKSLRYQAAMVDRVNEAIIATTVTGLVTMWNRAAEKLYCRPAALALAQHISVVVGTSLDPAAIISGGGVVNTTHYSADGDPLIVRVSAAAVDTGFALVCTDQTKAYRAQLFLQEIVNTLDEGILVVNGTGSVVSANPAAERILGMSSADLTSGNGRGIHRLNAYDVDRRPLPPEQHPVAQTLVNGKEFRGIVIGVDRTDKRRVWLRTNSYRLDGDQRYESTVLVSFADITAEHMAHEHLTHSASHDALTGLPNRLAVLNRIADSLRADGESRLGAVLFIDVDNLKAINDSLGHDSGDELLQGVARCLQTSMGALDVVGRLGGDEFVVLITGDVGPSELTTIVARIEQNLSEPMALGTVTVRTQASIGTAFVDRDDRRSAAEILRDADAAMYETKLTRRRSNDGVGEIEPAETAGSEP